MPRPLILLLALSLFSANLYAEEFDPTKLATVKKTLDKVDADDRRNRNAYNEANEKAFREAEKALKAEADRLSKAGKPEEAVAVKKLIEGLRDRLVGKGEAGGEQGRPPAPPRPRPVVPNPNVVVFNGHKYELFKEKVTWDEAKKKCEDLGGHLLFIEDRNEQAFFAKILTDLLTADATIGDRLAVWIGVRKNDQGRWVGLAGQEIAFTAWESSYPHNDHAVARMHLKGGRWETGFANNNGHWFICEWDRP